MARGITLILLVLVGVMPVGPAAAQNHCTSSAGVVTLTLPGGLFETLFVQANGDIWFSAGGAQEACDGATNSNTTSVSVSGAASLDRFILLREGTGQDFNPAIAFSIDLAASGKDELMINGTGGDDRITFGRAGSVEMVQFDGDPAADIELRNAERGAALDGGGGRDVLSGAPGGGLSPSSLDLSLNGGNKNDRVIGGNGDDHLAARTGNDRIRGGRGDDWLFGGPQNDRLNGGPGKDRCLAGGGSDTLTGCERTSRG